MAINHDRIGVSLVITCVRGEHWHMLSIQQQKTSIGKQIIIRNYAGDGRMTEQNKKKITPNTDICVMSSNRHLINNSKDALPIHSLKKKYFT